MNYDTNIRRAQAEVLGELKNELENFSRQYPNGDAISLKADRHNIDRARSIKWAVQKLRALSVALDALEKCQPRYPGEE